MHKTIDISRLFFLFLPLCVAALILIIVAECKHMWLYIQALVREVLAPIVWERVYRRMTIRNMKKKRKSPTSSISFFSPLWKMKREDTTSVYIRQSHWISISFWGCPFNLLTLYVQD